MIGDGFGAALEQVDLIQEKTGTTIKRMFLVR